ncbi:MAG: phosphoribosylamine--glycine ligase [Gammaproteobacteria bacterium]|nr:phosphoribosylamine--glycine ligase [Gammaproteobacteria bacterium]
MNVLIIGSGGREHALAWSAARSETVERVYVAPGNAGTATESKAENVDIGVDDFPALADFAESNGCALTIVGPEAPLVDGVRDYFDARGLACFGPSKAAAQLEGSKVFTKEFLVRHGIPTARYESFTAPEAARDYIRRHGAPIVVKASGLAAGKGVTVAFNEDEALTAAEGMLAGDSFGDAGREIVVEEYLDGEEASFICLTDGENVVPFATSQDHKARDDGDLGPNTGGMGAYSPAPVVTPEVHARIMDQVIHPTVRGMASDGAPYQGFLYAGLMVMPDGSVRVIEFNCRFGDPEAQPVLMRLGSDLVSLCRGALSGTLHDVALQWDDRAAVGVVMAAGGYPLAYESGHAITGLGAPQPDTKVFHAGTALSDGEVVTAGGRVLCVTALGDSVSAARTLAYERVGGIAWKDAYYRKDIGYRAVNRENG